MGEHYNAHTLPARRDGKQTRPHGAGPKHYAGKQPDRPQSALQARGQVESGKTNASTRVRRPWMYARTWPASAQYPERTAAAPDPDGPGRDDERRARPDRGHQP